MAEILRPLKAIRAKCVDCCGDNTHEVKHCNAKNTCPLWVFRFGTRPDGPYDKTPLKSIRAKCLMDCGEENAWQEVKNCSITSCPLWPHRFGKRAK